MTEPGDGADAKPVLVMLAAGVARRYGGCKPLAPVGLHGEAVIDLNAGDAGRAGFGEMVLIVGPATGAAVSYHVQRTWPRSVAVSLARQGFPLGTAHAVLGAESMIGGRRFAVINADGIYGVPALSMLAGHLRTTDEHALVSYRLGGTVVSSDPVTRGICQTTAEGWLEALVERRQVSRHEDGTITADDGLEPKELAADTPTSMNLWGFTSAIWPFLHDAVRAVHGDLADDGTVTTEAPASAVEVLLPEVVGAMVGGGAGRVRVLEGTGRCVGVTHAADVPVVRTELAEMVGQGLRPEAIWGTGR